MLFGMQIGICTAAEDGSAGQASGDEVTRDLRGLQVARQIKRARPTRAVKRELS